MHSGVVNGNSTLVRHLRNVAKAQWVGHAPVHAAEQDFQRIVKPLGSHVQGATDQTFRKFSMIEIVVYAYCDRTVILAELSTGELRAKTGEVALDLFLRTR